MRRQNHFPCWLLFHKPFLGKTGLGNNPTEIMAQLVHYSECYRLSRPWAFKVVSPFLPTPVMLSPDAAVSYGRSSHIYPGHRSPGPSSGPTKDRNTNCKGHGHLCFTAKVRTPFLHACILVVRGPSIGYALLCSLLDFPVDSILLQPDYHVNLGYWLDKQRHVKCRVFT
jgi:hypothetical protein